MPEDFEVLSALLDGDAVDIEGLEAALENPEGRRVFVDFVRLRQTAPNDDMTPRREFYDRVPADLALRPRVKTRSLPYPLAAAAVLVAMLLGSAVNLEFTSEDTGRSVPPEPTRVLQFEPGVDWKP